MVDLLLLLSIPAIVITTIVYTLTLLVAVCKIIKGLLDSQDF